MIFPQATEKTPARTRFIPLVLSFLTVLADQVSKYTIATLAPAGSVIVSWFNGLVRIVHVKNHQLAFSLQAGSNEITRVLVYYTIPLVLLLAALWYFLASVKSSPTRRWALAGIIGGASGNVFDRFLRPDGTIDFIDIRFFGILGLERWPTFNIADAALVLWGILLAATILFQRSIRS